MWGLPPIKKNWGSGYSLYLFLFNCFLKDKKRMSLLSLSLLPPKFFHAKQFVFQQKTPKQTNNFYNLNSLNCLISIFKNPRFSLNNNHGNN